MRPRKRDWKELEKAMPGVAPSGQRPWEMGVLYSVAGNDDATWSIVRGTLLRESKEHVTQRIEVLHRGTALEISQELVRLGFDLPLIEQRDGVMDLPTPKEIYFEACRATLPGRFLAEAGDATRIGLSLSAARRKGWKLHFTVVPEEDTLFSGGYLEALSKGEFPPIQVLGGWEGRNIGSRRFGVIRDEDLFEVLGWLGADPATVFGLGLEKQDASSPAR